MNGLLNFFSFKQKQIILFYGSNGWIGGLFKNYLKNRCPDVQIIEGKSRLDNKTDILIEISVNKPTHVISFTGRTHGTIDDKVVNTIDYLEYPGKLIENMRDNLYGPLELATICKKRKIHYTYLGTGCIFNSKQDQTFTEESLPNYFGSGYSVVKGYTDRLIKNYPCLNLRIRMPISKTSNSRNFINKITSYEKICSIANSMTILDDFFPIFADMIIHKKTGTWNCTNPGTISHNEILEIYRDTVNPEFTWKNFTIQEQSEILKSDRSNNELDTSKLEKYYNIKPIKESIKDLLKIYS